MPKHPRAAALFLASILLVGSASAAYAQYYSSSSRNNDDRRAAQERERREQAERERRKRAEQERRERERQQQAQRERQQREQAERQRRERAEQERRAREQQAQRERQQRAAQERQQREIAERTQRARQQELERQRRASQQRAQQSGAARQPQPSMTPTGVIRDGKYERYTPPTSSAPATLAPSHPRNQHPGTMRERPVPANNQQAPRTMTTPTPPPPRPFPENNPTVRLTPSGTVPARPANTPAGTGMIAAPGTPSRTVAPAPIASSGGNANCVSYREEGRGSHCGKPGSYHVRVTNNCASAQKARVCYTRENGTWSCYANLSVGPGRSESIGFACNAGQYRVSWADARSGQLEPPPAARPVTTPAPAPAPTPGKAADEKSAQKEALAFCWQNQAGNWFCDGKTQRLLTSYKDLNAALGLVGCKNPRRQVPWSGGGKSGTLFYCGYQFKYKPSTTCKDDSWERDIRSCYGVRD